MLVPLGGQGEGVLEHRSTTTSILAVSPYSFYGTVYDDPVLGGPVGIGDLDGFTVAYGIRFQGPGNEERCDGGDGDGDGLVDCADPDCWWKCTPACPPGVVCP
jgi:hypothetical protein